jgi:DNA-binding transcriptional LysR family regulator
MTLHRLEVFLTVAKHLSVTRAARELHVSQSAVSQEMKLLQDDHGAVFLKRRPRGVELTADGKAFRREVESILSRMRDLKTKHASTVLNRRAKS